jgi:hypothetical protein
LQIHRHQHANTTQPQPRPHSPCPPDPFPTHPHTFRSTALPILFLSLAAAEVIPRPRFLFPHPSSCALTPQPRSFPPARPVTLPATSPLTSPLPSRLRLLHHTRTHTHVVPQRAVVVRCDGVVGAVSLVLRSGVVRVEERGRGVWWSRGVDRAGAGAGAALGWVLRVCFRQPADGAGECWVWCGWERGAGTGWAEEVEEVGLLGL